MLILSCQKFKLATIIVTVTNLTILYCLHEKQTTCIWLHSARLYILVKGISASLATESDTLCCYGSDTTYKSMYFDVAILWLCSIWDGIVHCFLCGNQDMKNKLHVEFLRLKYFAQSAHKIACQAKSYRQFGFTSFKNRTDWTFHIGILHINLWPKFRPNLYS